MVEEQDLSAETCDANNHRIRSDFASCDIKFVGPVQLCMQDVVPRGSVIR